MRVGKYSYPNDVSVCVKINKKIKEGIDKICEEKKINKSRLIEEFYKLILVRFQDGSLNATGGFITMNILRSPICKK